MFYSSSFWIRFGNYTESMTSGKRKGLIQILQEEYDEEQFLIQWQGWKTELVAEKLKEKKDKQVSYNMGAIFSF